MRSSRSPCPGRAWNPYSYVGNSPLSRTDPTGYCYAAGPLCQVAGGGGFTNVTQTLTSWNMSWRIPVYATITWGRVSFGIGGSFWNGEGGGFFGRGGFFRPSVIILIGAPFPVFESRDQVVSRRKALLQTRQHRTPPRTSRPGSSIPCGTCG